MSGYRFLVNDHVTHKKNPKEYGAGTVLEILPNNRYIIRWEDFTAIWKEEMEESSLAPDGEG